MTSSEKPGLDVMPLPARLNCRVAVVIPCFRVRRQILGVIAAIGPECDRIFVVDDCCPEQTGEYVLEQCRDPRVQVVRNPANLGVGGAVKEGYRRAIAEGAEIIVKIDGDGQMDPGLIPEFLYPIASGEADYAKGNRFFDLTNIKRMPTIRLIGNAGLSFMSKFSTGYWDVFDPTNGFTAIHAKVAAILPLDNISNRYFFESDMLFRLNIVRAVVMDVPMDARYGDEISNLRVRHVVGEFFVRHTANFVKRVFYNYFLRDLSAASFELLLGVALFVFGAATGVSGWIRSAQSGIVSSAGTVMLAALPLLAGLQLLLAFIGHDVRSVPTKALFPRLSKTRQSGAK